MLRRPIFCVVLAIGCQKDPAPAPVASASVSVAPSAAPTVDTRSKWWTLAAQSKVFTEDRRIDADNRLKLLPLDQRIRVVSFLDRMAAQPATGAGFHDAGQIARDAQDQIRDPNASG